MSKVNSLKLNDPSYPDSLRHIDTPPKELFYIGSSPSEWIDKPKVAIVGSRKISAYGREVTRRLTEQLVDAGVVIISGLALGVDIEAHKAALDTGGITVAVLPTSIDKIYPAQHLNAARQILESSGTIISESAKGTATHKGNFIYRNRIVSGLCDVLVITEAAYNGGSLHTARFALEQGKTVMAVPGNITNENSQGTNNLIKSGALPVTDVSDILFALKINPEKAKTSRVFRGSSDEERILVLIRKGISSQEQIALKAKIDVAKLNGALTTLEINGYIRASGSGNWLSI